MPHCISLGVLRPDGAYGDGWALFQPTFTTVKKLLKVLFFFQKHSLDQTGFFKVDKILKGSLYSIPSPSVKIQNIAGKVYLRY